MNFIVANNQPSSETMENFEDAISKYVVKEVNKDNSAIVKYKFTHKIRRNVVVLKPELAIEELNKPLAAIQKRNAFKVVSPDGTIYESVNAAAKATMIKPTSIRYMIRTGKGWKNGDTKETV